MNAFQEDARAMIYGEIISAWLSFVATTEEMLAVYNAAHRKNPASITKANKSIIVQCCRKTDDLTFLTISISSVMVDFRMTITCQVQRWHAPPGTYPMDVKSDQPIEFSLEDGRLCYSDKRYTPPQAAEYVFKDALLD